MVEFGCDRNEPLVNGTGYLRRPAPRQLRVSSHAEKDHCDACGHYKRLNSFAARKGHVQSVLGRAHSNTLETTQALCAVDGYVRVYGKAFRTRFGTLSAI